MKIREETEMAQPKAARITCSQCNAWYSTERELRDHMQTAHRLTVPQQTSHAQRAAQKPDEYIQPDEDKETGGEG